MSDVVNKFLRYISYDTKSEPDQKNMPSTEKQFLLAHQLVKELKEMGIVDAVCDEHAYVYAHIPGNCDNHDVLSLGLIAHMDTSPACSGKDIKPLIIHNYDGNDILMNPEAGIKMHTDIYPALKKYVGQDLIITDGTTLLGADDKAGVAEIMETAAFLMTHPQIVHGKICIAFTPDEEVGKGADLFDIAKFGADIAYTVDGGELGEIEYENFNAASAKVTVKGVSVHTGSAKWKMKNSMLMAMELHHMLPVFENPICTDGYEGFYHLDGISGDVEETRMNYIIRDHDRKKLEEKKSLFSDAVAFMNRKYGEQTFTLEMKDSYYNMREKIKEHMELIEYVEEIMTGLEIVSKTTPIRGGTDGARLSYMGLPCPNICTGGANFHSRYEFVSIQSMEKIVNLLVLLCEKFCSIV